jgi:NTE family protein
MSINEIHNDETHNIITNVINDELEIKTEIDLNLSKASCYDTIVISGGSIKGIITLGALQYIKENFLLEKVNTYIGTSSGAIISYLLIIGYTPIDLIVYLCVNQLLEKLQNLNIVSMVNGNGASSFSNIYEQLEKMTITKIGILPTLKDLYNKFGKKLIIVTYNLTDNKTEYLSHETNPDLPCLIALRMSSNLPFIFENFQYENKLYIDGGISNNFAIDIGEKEGKQILGLVISLDNEVFTNMDIIEYMYKVLMIPAEQLLQSKLEKVNKDKCKIIKLSYSNINIFDFHIDYKIKLDMFSRGYQIMKENI